MRDFDDIYSVVKDLPVIDWHNHLDLRMLAQDAPLGSLYEVWVKADPYKHRAMRICGEAERVITGDAPEAEKWAAWMRTLPKLVGNPLFAWAKMEIEWIDFFNAESQSSRESMWWRNVENISLSDWTPSKMLKAFNVECICPCVSVSELKLDVVSPMFSPKIIPSLRMNAGDEISVEDLERFAAAGCRVVDVSVDDASRLSVHYSRLSTVASFAAAHDWTMLLHLGALRSTSERLRIAAGPAGGFAGMRAPVDPAAVASFLNELERTPNAFSDKERKDYKETSPHSASRGPLQSFGFASLRQPDDFVAGASRLSVKNGLPRTILHSLNPEAHAQLAVLSGSFVEDGMPGKVQLGPAWWWCDHAEGILDVLEKNAAYGVLSTFIGMTTDSRSLLSFVRHDYFRRLLCRWIAGKIESGSFPDDEELIVPMLTNICFSNAERIVK